MPAYEYECKTCTVLFEELHITRSATTQYAESFPCPKCGEPAPRAYATPSSFKFAGGVRGLSGVHGNSGVHDLDYPNLDKAVARSSEARWKFHAERQSAMRAAEASSEVGLASMNPDGSVSPMAKSDKENREATKSSIKSVES